MLVSTPLVSDSAPLARTTHTHGRIVWQQRYDGIAHVAYRGGNPIAGISGPWSDRYVLIWWDRLPTSQPLELFATLDEAKSAVEHAAGKAVPAVVARERASQVGWLRALLSWRRRAESRDGSLHRRPDEELDLAGLNFSALR